MNGAAAAEAPVLSDTTGRLEMSKGAKQVLAVLTVGAALMWANNEGLINIPRLPGGGSGGSAATAPEATGDDQDQSEGTDQEAGDGPSSPAADAPAIACEGWNITEDTAATLKQELTADAKASITKNGVAPSATVAVGCGKQTLAAFGVGSVNGEKPSANETAYDLSSVSKFINALGVLVLVDEGVVGLDDSVGKYLPDTEYATQSKKQKITFRMLLTHRSGIVDPPKYDPLLGGTPERTRQLLLDYPVAGKANARDSYSNIGPNIAYYAASAAAGRPLEEVVREKIFDPLGLEHSGWKGTIDNCAPTSLDANKRSVIVCESQDRLTRKNGHHPSHAGYIMSAGDLGKVMAMVSNGGKAPDGTPILSEEAIKALTVPLKGQHRGTGTGQNIKTSTGSKFYGNGMSSKADGHTGWNGTQVVLDPSGMWSVILTNGTLHKSAPQGAIYRANQRINNQMMEIVKPD